jgi:hypothetical protein
MNDDVQSDEANLIALDERRNRDGSVRLPAARTGESRGSGKHEQER